MFDNMSLEIFTSTLEHYLTKNGLFLSILTTDNLHKKGIDKIIKDTITQIKYVGMTENDKIKNFIKAK